jgi:hypothetical protein
MAALPDTIENRFAQLDESIGGNNPSPISKNAFLRLVEQTIQPAHQKQSKTPVNRNAPIDFLYFGKPQMDLNLGPTFGSYIDDQIHELSAQGYSWGIDVDENSSPYIHSISYQTENPTEQGQSMAEIIDDMKRKMDDDLEHNRYRVSDYPEFQREPVSHAGMSIELYGQLSNMWAEEGKISDEIENELIKYEASFFGAFIGIDPQSIREVTIGKKRVGHNGSSKTISLIYEDQHVDITDQMLAIVRFKLSIIKNHDIQCAARAVATTFNQQGFKDLKSGYSALDMNKREHKYFKDFSLAYFGQEIFDQHLATIEP